MLASPVFNGLLTVNVIWLKTLPLVVKCNVTVQPWLTPTLVTDDPASVSVHV